MGSTRNSGSIPASGVAPEVAKLSEQTSEWCQTHVLADVFNFSAGQPGPDLLDKSCSMIKLASEQTFKDEEAWPWMMQYGSVDGPPRLRKNLSEFLGNGTLMEDVFITTGVTNGLHILGSALASPGDAVIVEQPTYFLAKGIFSDLGLDVIPAPMDGDSIDLEALSGIVSTRKVKLMYLVPVHSNPTGLCKTREQKESIIDFVKKHSIYLLADEVYEMLSFGPRANPCPPFTALCRDPNIVSVSSFSKICAPGLRLGWFLAHSDVVGRVKASGVSHSGGGMNPLVGAFMCHALEEDSEGNSRMGDLLKETQRVLGEKCQKLCESLERNMPSCQFHRPEGGYFVFLELPDTVNAEDLLVVAEQTFKVKFTPGPRCFGRPNTIRISFAFYQPEEMEEGVQRLARALDHYLAA